MRDHLVEAQLFKGYGMPGTGKVEQQTRRGPASTLTEEQQKIIEGKRAILALVRNNYLKPLSEEPKQAGTHKSDVARGMFGQRNLSTVVGKQIGHDLSDLPEKILRKLPKDDRFVVHKSKTRDKVAYLEVKSPDFKLAKWFEFAPKAFGVPPKKKPVVEAKPVGDASPPTGGKIASIYNGLGKALQSYGVELPAKATLDKFWKAIEEQALLPIDPKHPEKGSRLRGVAEVLAAGALGTIHGISAERVNTMAMRMEASLIAESHRNLHEGYQTWQGLNVELGEAEMSSRTHNPGTVTPLSADYFKDELQKLVGDQFDNDTRMTLFGRGQNSASLRKRLELIDGAAESINLAVWKIYGDAPGKALADALIAKKLAHPTMPIRVMVDGNVAERDPASMRLIEALRTAGIDVHLWRDDFHPMSGMHWKALIIDAGTLHPQSIIGGRNVGVDYTDDARWRDTDVLYEGRGVLSAYQDFAWLWNKSAGQAGKGQATLQELTDADVKNAPIRAELASDTAIMSIVDHPGPNNPQHVARMLVKAINGAEKEIVIEQGYFLDVPVIIKALIEASRRGVKVRVLTNSSESNDVKGLDLMGKAALAKLVKQPNVELFTKKSAKDPDTGAPLNTLHSKFITVDGKFGAVGSWNQHGRSMLLEAEGMVAFFNEAMVAQLNAEFEVDVTQDAYRENAESVEMASTENRVAEVLELIGIAHM